MKSPLTGQNNTERLGVLSPTEIARRWRDQLGIDVGNPFRSLSVIEYWRCNTTGLGWYSPAQAAGDGNLYAQLERFDWYYMADKWEFRAALRTLVPGSRVLEVGAGSGHFLRAATEGGLIASGVELNPSAAARARDMGLEIFESDLTSLAERIESPFDAVCAFQVLEHVPDPRHMIEEMLCLLRPGGRLVLSVPNAAVMRIIDPKRENLLDQPPHHLSHWDVGVFRALQRLLPVKVRQVRREPLAPYHISWFLSAVSKSLRARLGRTAGRMLINRVTMPSIRWLLEHGLRLAVPGHTLLVVLEYRP